MGRDGPDEARDEVRGPGHDRADHQQLVILNLPARVGWRQTWTQLKIFQLSSNCLLNYRVTS